MSLVVEAAILSNEVRMRTEEILAAIDEQMAEWQRARMLLAGIAAAEQPAKRRGRPKGSTSAPAKKRTGTMSAEGKARIAAAQKARWAAHKRAAKAAKKKIAAKKSVAEKSPAKKTAAKKTLTKKAVAKKAIAQSKAAEKTPASEQ